MEAKQDYSKKDNTSKDSHIQGPKQQVIHIKAESACAAQTLSNQKLSLVLRNNILEINKASS